MVPPGIHASLWADRIEDWVVGQNLALTSPPGIPTCRDKGNQHDTTIENIWTNAAVILEDAFQDPIINFPALMGLDHAGLWLTYQHILELAINPPPPPQLSHFIIADNAQDQWIQHFLEVSP
jgi:hypothetical protein